MIDIDVSLPHPTITVKWRSRPHHPVVETLQRFALLNSAYTEIAYRTQFPFTLSWAATVHSVQGLTIKPLALYMPHVWAWGQLYVAYSRAPTQRDLVLVQHVPRMDVRPEYQETARKVLAFLREAESRQEQMLIPSIDAYVKKLNGIVQ